MEVGVDDILEFYVKKLIDVLKNPKDFPWNHALYMALGDPSLYMPVLVLDPDDVENPDDPDDDPVLAKVNGFKYALMMQDVEGVVVNAQSQKIEIDENDLMTAFLYYLRNDAYYVF